MNRRELFQAVGGAACGLSASQFEAIESVNVLSFRPDDKLMLKLNADHGQDAMVIMAKKLQEWSGVPVLLLPPGMEMEILRNEPCQT